MERRTFELCHVAAVRIELVEKLVGLGVSELCGVGLTQRLGVVVSQSHTLIYGSGNGHVRNLVECAVFIQPDHSLELIRSRVFPGRVPPQCASFCLGGVRVSYGFLQVAGSSVLLQQVVGQVGAMQFFVLYLGVRNIFERLRHRSGVVKFLAVKRGYRIFKCSHISVVSSFELCKVILQRLEARRQVV